MEKQILTSHLATPLRDTQYRSILLVIRYPRLLGGLGFLSMAIFHLPLFFNKKIAFYKLMGTGKNGSFDIWPDLSQWSIMVFYQKTVMETSTAQEAVEKIMGWFIPAWLRAFWTKVRYFHLEPYAGHGTWDNHSFITQRKASTTPTGKIAVLTRASIRLTRLFAFWKAVPSTSYQLDQQPGFQYSIGIGEVPLIKQATFSIWNTEADMKAYAYQMRAHQDVIRRTRSENWYAEEMFLRFLVLDDFSQP